ncbi:MAG: ribonuclease P protein component [Acidimicrobiales bacterium]|nr:ribonuclease P protein component [Acidimicrobiales bacterium]
MPMVEDDARSVVARPQLWRITDRATFLALRCSGRRVRRGPLWVTWLPPAADAAGEPLRVGFAAGRSAGGAVVRNRIRRRLRAALRELQRTDGLPGGALLIGAGAEVVRLPWSELLSTVRNAVTASTASS